MSEDGGEIGAFMAGFVIGGLVGAAAALLTAPQSGAETRAQIAAKSEELRLAGGEQIQHYGDVASSSWSDAQERMKETGEQVQERARIILDEGNRKPSKAQENSKERVQKAADDIAEMTPDEEGESGEMEA
jgi:gas vesicle protein